VGRSLLIRDRESVLWIKFDFGLFMVSFGGPKVERRWKLNNLSDKSVSLWLIFTVHDWELIFEGCFFYLEVSSDDGCWISFLQRSF
jgi:hypothetical protein